MTKYIVSYGGGVNSTAMIIWLVNNKKPIDYVVFADTGNEVPETYEFTEKYMKPYLVENKIEFVTVYPFGKRSLWTRCFLRKIIPSQVWRFCTRDVKVKPIHKFYKKLDSKIIQYMGIHYGEYYRMKPTKEDWIENSYPLIDNKINQLGCLEIIKNAGLIEPVKSGCFFCCFNIKERWEWLRKTHPDLYKLSQDLEKNNKHYPKQKLILLNESTTCDAYCMT